MVSDIGLISVGLISIAGMIIITQLMQSNYFKKMTFKHKLWQTKKLDTLNLKKMEKSLGIDKKTKGTGLEGIDIKGLIQQYMGGEEDEDSDNWLLNAIGQVAQENPELVQQVIGKVTGNTANDEHKNIVFEN